MKYTFVSLIMLVTGGLYAQTWLGIVAGGTRTNALVQLGHDTSPRYGLMAGVSVEHQPFRKWSLGADVGYMQRGYGYDATVVVAVAPDVSPVFASRKFRSHRSAVVATVKGTLLAGEQQRVYVSFGLVPSFLAGAVQVIPAYQSGSQVVPQQSIESMEGLRRWNCAALIEVGARVPFSSSYVGRLGVSFQQSFTSETERGAEKILHNGFILSAAVIRKLA